jgi:hypothetical protein
VPTEVTGFARSVGPHEHSAEPEPGAGRSRALDTLIAALEAERERAEAAGMDFWEWLARRLPPPEQARLRQQARLWRTLSESPTP